MFLLHKVAIMALGIRNPHAEKLAKDIAATDLLFLSSIE